MIKVIRWFVCVVLVGVLIAWLADPSLPRTWLDSLRETLTYYFCFRCPVSVGGGSTVTTPMPLPTAIWTPAPTYLPVPTSAPHGRIMYISANGKVNARSCERMTCPTKKTFNPGDQICVIGRQDGDFPPGGTSNIWFIVLLDDFSIAYVNSALASSKSD